MLCLEEVYLLTLKSITRIIVIASVYEILFNFFIYKGNTKMKWLKIKFYYTRFLL
jgi:hypothetical protein